MLCTLGVLPAFRRQGIGGQLLTRSEEYLRRRGATNLYAGPLAQINPFTFALYGGSQSPRLPRQRCRLPAVFRSRRGYRTQETCLVLRCALDRLPAVVDGRFPTLRQRYEIILAPRHGLTWFQECVLGPIELHDFHLCARQGHRPAEVSRVCLWEMETFGPAGWNQHAVGILEVESAPDLRKQGLAKFLLTMLLRHLHEQFFTLAEIHIPETNEAGKRLLATLGFVQTDTGRRFQRETAG